MTHDSNPPMLGMVVLKTDETVENESRFYLRDSNVRLLSTRITVSDTINADTLRAMRGELRQSLALFPEQCAFDVIAYACTSAATVIGEQAVADNIRQHAQTRHITNPLTAAKAALARLGARRIAYLSPYVSDVASAMQHIIQADGIEIIANHSFGIDSDRAVAALPPADILQALNGFASSNADAVFISCTNLRCASIIPAAEQQLGIPVISSNQALLWHTLTLAQAPIPTNAAYGRLFSEQAT